MAGINTLVLDQGISQAIDAQNDTGYFINLTSFGISETAGDFSKDRNAENTEWYRSLITNYQKIDKNTVQITCEVPPNAPERYTNDPVTEIKDIKEVYVYAEDKNLDEFLFAIAQPQTIEQYNPSGSYTLRIQLKILNVTVDSVYKFSYTQAQEVSIHNEHVDAHPNLFYKVITVDDSFVPVKNKVYVIKHDDDVDDIIVTLPNPEEHFRCVIKEAKGDITNKTVKIVTTGAGSTIDGDIEYKFTSNYQSVTLFSDGTDWYIV